MHIRQSKIAAGTAVRESLVVDSHQMQYRRVQIVDAHTLVDRFDPKIVGRTVGHTAPNAATSQPHAEARRMMIAAFAPGQLESCQIHRPR